MNDEITDEAKAQRRPREYARKCRAEDAKTLRGMARRLREGFYDDDHGDEFEEAANLFEAAAADMDERR
jgi:hypothetical protein